MSEIKVKFPNGEVIEATDIEENIFPDFGSAQHRFTIRITGNDKYTVQRLNGICTDGALSPLTVSSNGKGMVDVVGMTAVENISWRMSENNNVGEFVIILAEKSEESKEA